LERKIRKAPLGHSSGGGGGKVTGAWKIGGEGGKDARICLAGGEQKERGRQRGLKVLGKKKSMGPCVPEGGTRRRGNVVKKFSTLYDEERGNDRRGGSVRRGGNAS